MAEAHDLTKPLLNRNALSRPILYFFHTWYNHTGGDTEFSAADYRLP